MCKRWAWLAAVLVALIALPAQVEAGRRGYRRGPVRSVFGTLYDTNSPEWRASGGNMFMYEELMRQESFMRQQQMFLRQRQMLQKQAAGKKSTNPAGGEFGPGGAGRQGFAPPPAPTPTRKKRRTYQPTGKVGKAGPSSDAPPSSIASRPSTRVDSAVASSAPRTGARTVVTKRPGDP